jgi:cold shock CspA family protein
LPSFGYCAIGTAPETNLSLENIAITPAMSPTLRPITYAMKGFIMTNGTVKWFNSTKGFGFIQPDNGGADAFVHISAVERSGMREIVEGQKLSYDLERDNKSGKMSACNLQAV